MSRKRLFCIISVFQVFGLLAVSCASTGASAVTTVMLDEAIHEAGENIESKLEPSVIIALLNFDSPSEGFSEYVLEELSDFFVNNGKLVVVERKKLDIIRQEEKFQLSGEVSDASARSIGRKLGAQAIVSGSVRSTGKNYRLRIKTLEVESAAITASTAADIRAKDQKVLALLGGTRPIVESDVGKITITSEIAGVILIDGQNTGNRIKVGGNVTIANINTGSTEVAVREDNGRIIKMPNAVMVRQGKAVSVTIQRPVYDDFVWIPGGAFSMGSPANEPGRKEGEALQQQVTVSSFYMGKYEVTQKEWLEVMGENPSHFKGDNLPVEGVAWRKAVEYCNKRSLRDGLTPAYMVHDSDVILNEDANGYRLPVEAEWEYACRAGTTTAYSTGNAITMSQANYGGDLITAIKKDKVVWKNVLATNRIKKKYSWGTMPVGITAPVEIKLPAGKTTPVGSFDPNAWGLYDMHGNVDELCWNGNHVYEPPKTNPDGSVQFRILTLATDLLRGGSWKSSEAEVRSAYRYLTPFVSLGTKGFRLVRSY